MSNRFIRTIIASLFLGSVLLLCCWIRVQGAERIPPGQFTENDAYFYYWQATLISEQGHLPARDMHRWLPLGRDLGQTLNLYPYVLAYTHKVISVIFPNVTLYHVTFYMPVLCFCIGLGALFLFLYHTHGLLFSSIVGVILLTLPGSIERSTAGFGDRDAWCLMVGILTVVTYLISLQVQDKRFRLLWTIISGFIAFLGGMSWEGFGVFLSVIFVVELWRFLTNEKEEDLLYYLFWVLAFVPMLWLASPAYRNGYGFSQHIAAFVLVPPVIIGLLRYIPHWVNLYYNHVHNATTEREILSYLKTHRATHLMLTGKDPKKSFLRKQLSDAFVPIYPSATKFEKSWVKIWKIHYPSDIKSSKKYLATEPEKYSDL